MKYYIFINHFGIIIKHWSLPVSRWKLLVSPDKGSNNLEKSDLASIIQMWFQKIKMQINKYQSARRVIPMDQWGLGVRLVIAGRSRTAAATFLLSADQRVSIPMAFSKGQNPHRGLFFPPAFLHVVKCLRHFVPSPTDNCTRQEAFLKWQRRHGCGIKMWSHF